MSSQSLRQRLDAVHPKMLRLEGETVLKSVQEQRKAYADVLWRAAQLARISSDKELAVELGDENEPIGPSQLSAWKSGIENPQTWRWERHPRLGPALVIAQAERQAHRGVRIRTVIEVDEGAA